MLFGGEQDLNFVQFTKIPFIHIFFVQISTVGKRPEIIIIVFPARSEEPIPLCSL